MTNVTCAWCGKPLNPHACRASERRYCCQPCQQAMWDYRRRGVGTPGRKPVHRDTQAWRRT